MDQSRLDLLWKLLARNCVHLTDRALHGSQEHDDIGVDGLFRRSLGFAEMQRRLTAALERHIRAGRPVNRIDYAGDDVRGDPIVFHEFRLLVGSVRVYVKASLNDDEDVLVIRSVKRQN